LPTATASCQLPLPPASCQLFFILRVPKN